MKKIVVILSLLMQLPMVVMSAQSIFEKYEDHGHM